jgi:hypothetical protein
MIFFGKPVSTFPDHAQALTRAALRMPRGKQSGTTGFAESLTKAGANRKSGDGRYLFSVRAT